jgi:branched-chain amino acid transport system substrate-binding protein
MTCGAWQMAGEHRSSDPAEDATGTDEAGAVRARMRATPINAFMTRNGRIREDGRVIRDLFLLQVKTPAGEWTLPRRSLLSPASRPFVRFGK